jgi:hypothetical protein
MRKCALLETFRKGEFDKYSNKTQNIIALKYYSLQFIF